MPRPGSTCVDRRGGSARTDGRRARGPSQRQQDRLQNERRRSGTSTLPRRGDIESVSAGNRTVLWHEREALRVQLIAANPSPADTRDGTHRGQMLGGEPRPSATGADVVDGHGLPVNADSVSAVLRIWPPPSPWLPSMTRRSPSRITCSALSACCLCCSSSAFMVRPRPHGMSNERGAPASVHKVCAFARQCASSTGILA